jgi:hypothetical protein
MAGGGGDAGLCFICFDADTIPAPIQSGCACRGEAGVAHVGCRTRAAEAQTGAKRWLAWQKCQTCKQEFTGQMRRGLADAWWGRMRGRAEDDDERLAAALNMASSLSDQGEHDEAEALQRHVLKVQERVVGPEHPDTLGTRHNLSISLSGLGKHPEAEALQRHVLEVMVRVAGPDHPKTLTIKHNLANSLVRQGKYPEAEALQRHVLEVQERVLGPEHSDTLWTKANLAISL